STFTTPQEGSDGSAARRRRAEQERAKAEGERSRAEARLRDLERERRTLDPAPQAPDGDAKRKNELARLAAEKALVERELQEAVERAKKAQQELAAIPKNPVEAPPADPGTGARPQPAKTDPTTQSTLARVEEVQGRVFLLGLESTVAAAAGTDLKSGQGIETGEGGRALLRFPDKTQVELGPETTLREILNEKGKRLLLTRGRIRADVTKQPKDQPLVFATPHGDAKVVGTSLRLIVDPDAKKETRLEVEEGKVELQNLAGKSVLVESGHYAVASAAVDPVVRALPIDDILVLPRHGKIAGSEWRRVKDESAADGSAFETTAGPSPLKAPVNDVEREKLGRWFIEGKAASWVTFTFQADAGRDYFVWVRGRCLGSGDRMLQDSVCLDVATGRFARRPADWFPYPDTLCFFDGYFNVEGYWWSGGSHDPGRSQTPIVVRFTRPGTQTIRMYLAEPPMRIDAIWLSVSQADRPKANDLGPMRGPK
ncbi:MAG TPA: FecR family protein, partial [Planctomycetota bacterium]|nr:FecR family protein [Planctomycetota bacterium]